MTSKTFFFLSPHLDDVVLSCGGLMYHLAAQGHAVWMITFFTADLPAGAPPSWLAQRNHRAWQLTEQPFAARRAEDLQAARTLGVQTRHLGMLDAMYRAEADGSPRYPHNTVGVPLNLLHREDIQAQLGSHITDLIHSAKNQKEITLFCPLGAGGHVDHRLVRQAVEKSRGENALWYYEDYPYACKGSALQQVFENSVMPDPGGWQSAAVHLSETEIDRRIQATGCYTSQIAGLFPSLFERGVEIARTRLPGATAWLRVRPNRTAALRRMNDQIRQYLQPDGVERYWQWAAPIPLSTNPWD